MKKIISLIFIVLYCSSCIGQQNNNFLEYENDLQDFPSFLVDFFPDTLGKHSLTIKGVDTTSQCIYFMSFDFDKKINLENYLMKYNAADSNLITIKRESILWWDRSKKVYYDSLFIKNRLYYPIPFFEKNNDLPFDNIFSDATISGLSKNFDIYVIDSKSGNYWKGLEPLDYMPKGWKNGYSKGICVNKKERVVIYWLIIW